MQKPVVAIVGRPNVGKSTFFNKIIGKRLSIEENISGVTRDRVYHDAIWQNTEFTLIDTGGLEPDSDEKFSTLIKEQVQVAIELSDLILFIVDAKDGLVRDDEIIAEILRKTKKRVIVVVNKIDVYKDIDKSYDFYLLGYDLIGISSVNMLNFGDLLDLVVKKLPVKELKIKDEDTIKVAIVGKPNVGKSSLLNLLCDSNRAIVTNISGTTRESIDENVVRNGKNYIFTDTAGIRRKSRIRDSIENYSVIRSLNAIDDSDITMLVVDAQDGFSEQDKRIIGHAHNNGKGILVLVNKWDLIKKDNKTYKKFKEDFYNEFSFLRYALVEMISVLEKERTFKIYSYIDRINENRKRRITTGRLNDIISEAILMNSSPADKGRKLKIYYASQVDIEPPKFILFINKNRNMHFSYKRYLENAIRRRYDFSGTPIIIETKEKSKDE